MDDNPAKTPTIPGQPSAGGPLDKLTTNPAKSPAPKGTSTDTLSPTRLVDPLADKDDPVSGISAPSLAPDDAQVEPVPLPSVTRPSAKPVDKPAQVLPPPPHSPPAVSSWKPSLTEKKPSLGLSPKVHRIIPHENPLIAPAKKTQVKESIIKIGGSILSRPHLVVSAIVALIVVTTSILLSLFLFQRGSRPVVPTEPESKPLAAAPTTQDASTSSTGTLSCADLRILTGTTERISGRQIEFECLGQPAWNVKNCRFRFGDGSAEAYDADCKVSHSYSEAGTYQTSCQVEDQAGSWRAASACEETLLVVAGGADTSGSRSSASPIPTVPQQELPQAGGLTQTVGALVAGIVAFILGALLLL